MATRAYPEEVRSAWGLSAFGSLSGPEAAESVVRSPALCSALVARLHSVPYCLALLPALLQLQGAAEGLMPCHACAAT